MTEKTTTNNSENQLQDQVTLFKNLLARSLAISKQSYANNQSDDPCIGIRLTERQRGQWEGRIEMLEMIILSTREAFPE